MNNSATQAPSRPSQSRKGLHHWEVLKNKKGGPNHFHTKLEDTSVEQLFNFYSGTGRSDQFNILKNGEEVDGHKHKIPEILTESMFPLSLEDMKAYNIDYSMRIMPHDQNSGGFYVAKFIKKGEVLFGPKTEKKQTAHVNVSGEDKEEKEGKKKNTQDVKKEYMKFEDLDKEGCDRIFDYYGLDEVRKIKFKKFEI